MSDTLFDLEIEWAPLYKPFGLTLLSLMLPDRCRDCGIEGHNTEHFCQGSREAGTFVLCDVCAALDPHWGIRVSGIADLGAQRQRRGVRLPPMRGRAHHSREQEPVMCTCASPGHCHVPICTCRCHIPQPENRSQ